MLERSCFDIRDSAYEKFHSFLMSGNKKEAVEAIPTSTDEYIRIRKTMPGVKCIKCKNRLFYFSGGSCFFGKLRFEPI